MLRRYSKLTVRRLGSLKMDATSRAAFNLWMKLERLEREKKDADAKTKNPK